MQRQYPEYADILTNKDNEVKKEIFLHNHKPLIDFLSTHYRYDFQKMTFSGMKNFFEVHNNDFKEERIGVRNNTLIYFVDFNFEERRAPKLKLQAFLETIKNKGVNSNLECPNSLDNEIKSSIQDNSSVQHIIAQKDNVDTSVSTSQSMQESKWPVVATSTTLAIVGVTLGIAIAVYLEMLAVGIAVGACCLVAAAIIYCCSGPSNSLEKSSAGAGAATIGTPLKP